MTRPATIALWALLSVPAPAAEGSHWLRIKSSNFDVFTSASERSGREVARHFEQIRSFFLDAMGWGLRSGPAVRIIVFRSEKEFRPYAPNSFALAYYLGAPDRDYIVMDGAGGDNFPMAVHEYTHLLVKHAGLAAPVWFNEGLAELFSNLAPRGAKIEVGDVIPQHFTLLRVSSWIGLPALFAAQQDSPFLNEKSHAGIFYAESWALVHMLYLGDGYRPKFQVLLEGMKTGGDMNAAFQKAYSKPLEVIERDLRSYLKEARFNGVLFNSRLPKSVDTPEVTAATDHDAGIVTAEMLANTTGKAAAARELYVRLGRESPKDSRVEEGLAWLCLREKKEAEAVSHYARAANLGSDSAKLHFEFGRVLLSKGNRADAIRALKRATEIDPANDEAHLDLGYVYMTDGSYADALNQLQLVKHVPPDQNYSYYHSLAHVSYWLGRGSQAREAAASARKYANTPGENAALDQIERGVQDQPAPAPEVAAQTAPPPALPPPAPAAPPKPRLVLPTVEGTLKQIDCLGSKIRLSIVSGAKTMSFAITNPAAVAIKNDNNTPADFTCGAQKPRGVRVEYDPKPNVVPGAIGVIHSIEFE